MSTENEENEPATLADVNSTFETARVLLKKRTELRDYFRDLRTESGIGDKERTLLKKAEDIQNELAALETEFEALDPDALEEYRENEAAFTKLTAAIKKVVYRMPNELFRSTQRLEIEGVGKLTVSKTNVYTEYDPEILVELPGLLDMEIDGDPVVERRLNSAMVQRLVAQGAVPAAIAEKYGTLIRSKAPSVKVMLDD